MSTTEEAPLNELLRELPQVEAVLQALDRLGQCALYRRDVVTRIVQGRIADHREALRSGKSEHPPSADALAAAVSNELAALAAPGLRRVVNATGIVLHTNLGRAVLTAEAQQAVAEAAAGYSDLEMDLRTGQRTRRDVRIEPQLCALAGCEAATVVNNNAAAVFLALRVLAAGREVITSRGELIEIGGSFRIPDIVRESGCTLVEVGTTNRTRLNDYERVVTPQTALILKTHSSNYRVRGFTAEVELADLAGLARKHRLLLFYDLGSGYISPSGGPALPEPDVLAAIREGADLVSFSGDKLLRGPQAGILIGRRDIVARLRRNPLWRVLRIDKLTAAALSATLVVHLRATGMALHEPGDSLSGAPLALAEQLAAAVAAAQPLWRVRTEQGTGFYGGGSLPDEEVPSALVLVEHPRLPAEELDRLARGSDIPVVGYVQRGAYVLNVLALLPGDVERIAQCLGELPRD